MIPVDGEVSVPLPVLQSMSLRLWRSPRTLVGGEALKSALEAFDQRAKNRRGSVYEDADIGEEVVVTLPSRAFDKKAKVVERNSQA